MTRELRRFYAVVTVSLPNSIANHVALFATRPGAEAFFAQIADYANEQEQEAAYEAADGGDDWAHRFAIVECWLTPEQWALASIEEVPS